MAFTTPKTNNLAGDGLDYLHLNKIEENIRILAGGDNTLPLSTDAATAYALVKRDIDGSAKFVDIDASGDMIASGAISGVSLVGSKIYVALPLDVLHVSGLSAGDALLASSAGPWSTDSVSMVKLITYKTPYSGTLRIKFTLSMYSGITAYGQIYKNGIPTGTLRSASDPTTFSEDLAFSDSDTIEIWARGTGGVASIISAFQILANTVAPYGFY